MALRVKQDEMNLLNDKNRSASLISKGIKGPAILWESNNLFIGNTLDLVHKVCRSCNFKLQRKGDIADHFMEVATLIYDLHELHQDPSKVITVQNLLFNQIHLNTIQDKTGIDLNHLLIRRMQFNKMVAGHYNNIHCDKDLDENIIYTMVIYFSDPSEYVGGEINLFNKDLQLLSSYRPKKYSTLIFEGDVPHSLSPLESCIVPRESLVILFSKK